MKIVIDISQVVYGTGVSVYTKELTRALLQIAPEHQFILYAGVLRRRSDLNAYLKNLKGSYKLVVMPLPPRLSDLLWNYTTIIPLELFTGHADIVHVSDWTEPFTHAPKISTIHDLSPILYPNLTHERIRRVFRRKLELIKNNSDLIIVPSLTIEKELIQYGISAERIHVIPEAPNPDLVNAPYVDIHKRFGIKNKFILMVGTAERKNVHRGIDAFRSLHLPDTTLVVVGEKTQSQSREDDIVYTGFVSTNELSNLYKEAEVFLYPSLYEGFGLPILEAYSMHCPVVTSNLGSMQEVGDAAVLVNPFDTVDISRGIKKALNQQKELVLAGKNIVKKYSWKVTAQQTLKVYQKAHEKL